jgi:hypothetical protein
LDKYNRASSMLAKVKDDPVSAWSVFNQFVSLEERLDHVTKALGLYFSEKNI